MSLTARELATSVVQDRRVRRLADVWTVRTGLAWLPCAPGLTAALDQLQADGALAVDRDGFADPQNS